MPNLRKTWPSRSIYIFLILGAWYRLIVASKIIHRKRSRQFCLFQTIYHKWNSWIYSISQKLYNCNHPGISAHPSSKRRGAPLPPQEAEKMDYCLPLDQSKPWFSPTQHCARLARLHFWTKLTTIWQILDMARQAKKLFSITKPSLPIPRRTLLEWTKISKNKKIHQNWPNFDSE